MALPIPAFLTRLASIGLLMGASLPAAAGALSSVSVVPADDTPGATTSYTFTYTVETQVGMDEAVFYVSFPPEYTLGAGSACDWVAITLDSVSAPCNGAYGSGNTRGVAVNTTAFGGPSVPAGTVIEIVVSDVTNPATPGDYVFDPSGTPNFDTGIRTVMSPGDFMPMEIDVAPQQTVTIGAGGLVNGSCGTSDGGLFSSTPVGNLCTTGSASAVTDNPTTFDWTCDGSGGGTNANCSADLGYDLILSISPPSGGSILCTANPVIHGGNTTCTPTASTGYSFADWSGDCTGATCVLNSVTSVLNPQANFTLNSYAITTAVSPVGAGSGVSCTNNPVNHGDDSTCSYSAPNVGYTFSNWSGGCTGATCDLTNVTGATSVTANFTAPTFAITTAVSPVGAGTATCTPNPVSSGSNASCSATAATGYTFSNWSGDCSGASCSLGAVAAAKSVTANFALNTYSVSGSAAPSAGGSVSCSGSVSHGGNGSCTATVNSGYSLSGWTGCSSSSGSTCTLSNVTSNKAVSANFALNSYTLSASVSPVNAGSASCTTPVSHGGTGSCSATAASGFVFGSWSGACTGASCSLVNVSANQTVTANFVVATYSLSGSAVPLAGGSVSCSSAVTHGASGSCTALANAGYTFSGWTGCSSASGASCNFTDVTANGSATANFTINSYTVTATANPIDAGSATCTSPVNHGAAASCTANPAAGYRVKDWSGACTGSRCAIASVTANSAVTANFELLPIYNIGTSVAPADSGTITCTKDVMEGGTATCTAKAKAGYRFSSWGGDCSGSNCTITNVTSAKNVTANFEEASEFLIYAAVVAIDGTVTSTSIAFPEASLESGIHCRTESNWELYSVPMGENVACTYYYTGYLERFLPFKGWSGDCSRIEGTTCYLDNVSTDKAIVASMGYQITEAINIQPSGAGTLWCDSPASGVTFTAAYARDKCKAEANPGYTFASYQEDMGVLQVKFTKQENTPVVVCSNCNNSTTSTDTTTTNTASQTSAPDNQGNSTQSTVSTTTNTQTGGTSTSVVVNQATTNGQTIPGGTFTTNDTNTQATVNNNGTVSAVSNNLATGSSTTASITSSGISLAISGGLLGGGLGGGFGATIATGSGNSVSFSQSSTGTQAQITNANGQPQASVTTQPTGTTVTTPSSSVTSTGSPTDVQVSGGSTTTSAPLSQNGASVSTTSNGATSTASITSGAGITTSAPLIPGTTVTVSACCYVPGTIVTFTLRSNISGLSKPGAQKTAASKSADERGVVFNMDEGAFQSVVLNSAAGSTTLFTADPASPLAPQLTDFDMAADSFSLTLSYPAVQ